MDNRYSISSLLHDYIDIFRGIQREQSNSIITYINAQREMNTAVSNLLLRYLEIERQSRNLANLPINNPFGRPTGRIPPPPEVFNIFNQVLTLLLEIILHLGRIEPHPNHLLTILLMIFHGLRIILHQLIYFHEILEIPPAPVVIGPVYYLEKHPLDQGVLELEPELPPLLFLEIYFKTL